MKKYNLLFLSLLISFSSNYKALSSEKVLTIDNNNLYPENTMKKDANKAFEIKNYSKAKLLYERLYKKSPHNYYYLLRLADSFFMMNDYNNAYNNYIKVIKDSENNDYILHSKKKIKEINDIAKKLKNKIKINKEDKKTIGISDDENNNYLCNSSDPTIFKDELNNTYRRWEKEDMPLKIYIPKIPEEYQVEDSMRYSDWIKKSIDRWMGKIPSFISYTFVDNIDKANVIVNWSNYFKDNSWGVAQMPHIDTEKNKKISNINLAVRAKLPYGEFFFSEPEFLQIVTHEFGHTLGLAHSYNLPGNNDMMYPKYQSRIPGSEPDITERDINTLKKLYSLDPEINYVCK